MLSTSTLSEQTLIRIGIICTGAISGLLLYSIISAASSAGQSGSQRRKRHQTSMNPGNPFNQVASDPSELFISNSSNSSNNMGNIAGFLVAGGVGSSSVGGSTFAISHRQRPRAAGGGSRRPILTPESLQLPDISIETIANEASVPDVEVFAVDESDNLLNLIMSIAEEQTLSDTIIHRSVTCNHCGMSPVRGWRFKCANCVDFDLCAGCEALDVHYKTHTFIKIRIPIPPQANPRSLIFQPFYPGIPWITTPTFDTSKLEAETHFDSMEIMGFYEQFKSLSTVDTQDGGITKVTFEKCLGTLKKESQMIVDRIFSFFDADGDGIISFEAMVRGLSVLCKGTMEERIKYAFEGYDLNGDGFISRDELRKMFKSYFLLSMELVRGVVKVMEEGMLDTFDDEAEKPVSAAFGAPSTLNNSGDGDRGGASSLSSTGGQDADKDDVGRQQLMLEKEQTNSNLIHTHLQSLSDMSSLSTSGVVVTESQTDAPVPSSKPVHHPVLSLQVDGNSATLSSPHLTATGASIKQSFPRRTSLDMSSPLSRNSVPSLLDQDQLPLMESISHDAIEEMVEQVFLIAHVPADCDFMSFEEFRIVVEQDVNILAWIEALGSVF